MNLLNDELEKRINHSEEDTTIPDQDFDDLGEEPVIAQPPEEEPTEKEQSDKDYRKVKKQKSILLPIILIIMVFVVGTAAVYLGFFKGRKTTELLPPPSENPFVTEDSLKTPSTKTVEKPTSKQEKPQEQKQQPVKTVSAKESAFANAMSVLYDLFGQRSQSVKISSVFLDESSVLAEVTSVSKTDVQSYYDKLTSLFSERVNVRLVPGHGNHYVINGLMTSNRSEMNEFASSNITRLDFQNSLKKMAVDAGITVQELAVNEPEQWKNSKRSLVYIKCNGSMTQIENLLKQISQQGWNIKLLKLILTAQNDSFSLVTRFHLINPQ